MKTKLALSAFAAALVLTACGSKTEAPAPAADTTPPPPPRLLLILPRLLLRILPPLPAPPPMQLPALPLLPSRNFSLLADHMPGRAAE